MSEVSYKNSPSPVNYWRSYGNDLRRNGWSLVPILPVDATPSPEMDGNGIAKLERGRGKAPGQWRGDGWIIPAGWRNRVCPSREGVDNAASYPGSPGIGIVLDTLPVPVVAADSDVSDPALADEIKRLAVQHGIPLTFERIGLAPKALWLFRTNEPMEEMKGSQWRLPDDPDGHKGHRVEIMTTKSGGQFVAFGTHKATLAPYRWTGPNPTTVKPDDLPLVDVANVRAWKAACDELLSKHGVVKGYSPISSKSHAGPREPATPANLLTHDPAWLSEIIREWLPNGRCPGDGSGTGVDAGASYEFAYQMAMAIKGAWGREREAEGREFWMEWATSSDQWANDHDWAESQWAKVDINNLNHGEHSILKWARVNGWIEFDVIEDWPGLAERETKLNQHAAEADFLALIYGDEANDNCPVAKNARIEVQYSPETFDKAADKAGKAMLRNGNNRPVLAHAGRLVTISYAQPEEVRPPSGGKMPPMPLVLEYKKARLRERIHADVDTLVLRRKGDRLEWVSAPPPDLLVDTLLGRGPVGLGGDGVDAPPLAGIVEAPTLRPDGSLLQTPGYDDATNLYLFDAGVKFPPIPENPSHDDARAAYKVLRHEVFAEFPFASDLDGDVAVALLLTAAVGRSLGGQRPAVAVMAPVQSSGKTALFDLVSRIVWGRPAPCAALPENDEEMRKVLVGILLQGQPAILFDNIKDGAAFRSEEIAKVLTSEVYQARILGVNDTPTFSTNIIIGLTGNNIRMPGDMMSRVLRCYLQPAVDSPHKRSFGRDLRTWAAENRVRVVVAALTLLRAWVVAEADGATVQTNGTRFIHWGRRVRDALVWAGGADVAAGFAGEIEEDDDRVALRLMHEILGRFPDGLTASAILALRTEDFHGDAAIAPDIQELAGSAVERIFGERKPSPKGMGNWLDMKKGQVVEGRMLVKLVCGHTKSALWRVSEP